MRSVVFVDLSVRLFLLYLSNQLTLDFGFCITTARRGLTVNVKGRCDVLQPIRVSTAASYEY